MGLGEFEVLEVSDDFEGYKSIKVLLWIYFIAGTLITQIIVFNTLIAILGDTYSKIMDSREQNSIEAKTAIYSDLMD